MGATMSNEVFLCEICGDSIRLGERIVRITAESCSSDEVLPRDSLVFGTFHSSCVIETFRAKSCDSVPYIEEAREAIMTSPLCECCSDKLVPCTPEVTPKHGLRLVRGGLS